ncbi:MAG: hypothetical protein LBV79_01305 [Candidatus Adiutrix sp.]|jgi:hypothetical protein|nr:hypothetical protein [Candidatus Adiutrix sp.]
MMLWIILVVLLVILALAGLMAPHDRGDTLLQPEKPPQKTLLYYVGNGLRIIVLLSFVVVFLFALLFSLLLNFRTTEYSFNIHNYSDRAIILRKVTVRGDVLFSGEHRLCSCPGPQSLQAEEAQCGSNIFVDGDFSSAPGKIKLIAYDTKLEKEIQMEVKSPRYPRHPFCPLVSIVYDQDGFRYKSMGCG